MKIPAAPTISVVIPTRDRPALLRRCLQAVLDQQTNAPFDVVVVNDRGCPVDDVVGGNDRVRLVEGAGRGPAAARNAGIAVASGEIVLFTDDDAVPEPGWVEAAIAALHAVPDAVGVTGRVISPEFDPLYEHSVRNDGGTGNFLTCNIAYRRSVLEQVGRFDEGFRYAAEDRDLGYRAQRLGQVVYEPSMVVTHPPRRVSVGWVVRRARLLADERRLHAKHPQTRPPRWSARWGPLIRLIRHWQRLAAEGVVAGSPQRAARLAVMAVGQTALATWVTVRGPMRTTDRPPAALRQEPTAPLRVAWIGPTPVRGGGVAGVGWQLLHGLAQLDCEIDCFLTGDHDQISRELWDLPRVRVVNFDTGWRFDRWYSNNAITKVLTGLAATGWGRRRLASLLVEQHRLRPYDLVYQFSTIELFGLRRLLDELPPIVVHPETHAAGELRGLRAERHLAAQCEPRWRRMVVEALQSYRARRQRRDIGEVTRVVAISQRFGQHLIEDYGVKSSRLIHAPNPIDLETLQPSRNPTSGRRRIAFVSRISVRKGVDAIVELTHRLGDLEGEVVVDIVGAETLWSNYRPLLEDLNPAVGRYRGYMQRDELAAFLASTDLLVQAATFEPFGLTVGEALACGVPVVATDEVGAAEDVDERCCIVVPAGDADALEKAVREMLTRLEGPESVEIRPLARAEAERLFDPGHIAALVHQALLAAAKSRSGAA